MERLIRDAAVIYVSGKGGAGKTTVATALGVAAARAGRRTIVCELAGAGRLAGTFKAPWVPGRETPLVARLWAVSIDPDLALREWLRRQPGGALADAVLGRSPAFAQLVAAGPGAKEVVTIGKVLDLAGLAPARRETAPYDLVVVDASSTGHAVGMVAAPGTISESLPVGPVGAQARALRAALADPSLTAYVGVSLPEEMSTREILDLEHGLRDAIGRGLDLVVANGVWPDRFSDEDADLLLAHRGFAQVRAALIFHRHARRDAAQLKWLRERSRCPVVALPYVFAPDLGRAEGEALADELTGPPALELARR